MPKDILARLGGLALVALGLVLGWYFIWSPLQQAYAGAPEIQYSLKIFLVVPLCVIFGLAFAIFGSGLNYRNVEKKTLTPMGWALIVIIAILTGIGFFWFKQQFGALGYTETF